LIFGIYLINVFFFIRTNFVDATPGRGFRIMPSPSN